MPQSNYDIFISYRREGGAQYARILQLMLIQRGYRVFLDYDEVKDGRFNDKIKEAIAEAPIFMIVLSKDSIDRCNEPEDWVAQEISEAVRLDKRIIPINPDGRFEGIHTNVPDIVRTTVKYNQHSEIYFGQVLGATVDQMIRDRIEPIVGKRSVSTHCDDDYATAKQTLQRLNDNKNTTGNKLNLKFLFQYKGCLISLTLCLLGIIIFPLLYKSISSPEISGLSHDQSDDMLAYIPVTFSKEGFILDVDYVVDYQADSVAAAEIVEITGSNGDYDLGLVECPAADSAVIEVESVQDPKHTQEHGSSQEPVYSEPEYPDYIKSMENGVKYVQERNYTKAYAEFLKAANSDYPDAMYNVAICHLTGLGAKVDTVTAVQWLQKASEFGNEPAPIKLKSLKKQHK